MVWKFLKDMIYNSSNNNWLFEMANIKKNITGLPMNVWVDEHGASRNVKHNEPRLKIQTDKADKVHGEGIPISISSEPKVLVKRFKAELSDNEINQAKEYIVKHLDILLKHWYQEIDTDELKEILGKEQLNG